MSIYETTIAGQKVYYDTKKKKYVSKAEYERRKKLTLIAKQRTRTPKGTFKPIRKPREKPTKPTERPKEKPPEQIDHFTHTYDFTCRINSPPFTKKHKFAYRTKSRSPNREYANHRHDRFYVDHRRIETKHYSSFAVMK